MREDVGENKRIIRHDKNWGPAIVQGSIYGHVYSLYSALGVDFMRGGTTPVPKVRSVLTPGRRLSHPVWFT